MPFPGEPGRLSIGCEASSRGRAVRAAATCRPSDHPSTDRRWRRADRTTSSGPRRARRTSRRHDAERRREPELRPILSAHRHRGPRRGHPRAATDSHRVAVPVAHRDALRDRCRQAGRRGRRALRTTRHAHRRRTSAGSVRISRRSPATTRPRRARQRPHRHRRRAWRHRHPRARARERAKLRDVYRQIRTLGAATGHDSKADAVATRVQHDIDEAVESLPRRARKLRYFYELSDVFHTVSSNTFIGELLAHAGLVSIAGRADAASGGFPQLSAEAIIAADPDVVFLAHTDGSELTRADVAQRPGWDSLQAVRKRSRDPARRRPRGEMGPTHRRSARIGRRCDEEHRSAMNPVASSSRTDARALGRAWPRASGAALRRRVPRRRGDRGRRHRGRHGTAGR